MQTDARSVVAQQLDLTWSFANDFIIGKITPELALWKPTPNAQTIHPTPHGWSADWVDEEPGTVPPPATIGWVLWHIEWWWTNTIAQVDGQPTIAPTEFFSTGGTDRIVELKAQWEQRLMTVDLDAPIQWVLPGPQPFSRVAGWLNIELMKNLAEINQTALLHADRSCS